ncbi:ATP-binding protein [Phenylobacterium sp.]|uniref:ATP-binding protein n=1 Tax=Phenylobacterium sp. TaxID=1871053 RepID=UPI002C8D7DF5|nr:ATP-binding protein [Phenylobacterium sp.]HVI32114.1 ATP-binding protein [Phenylobacterium sp.]
MFKLAQPDLVEAVVSRRQQIGLRVAIGLGMAVGLGPLLGWAPAVAWLAGWYAVQFAEYQWAGRMARRLEAGRQAAAGPPLALMFLANGIFDVLALSALLSDQPWTMMVGVLILTGALLNAAAVSRSSRAAFCASALPTALLCLALPPFAWLRGASPAETFAVATGTILLLTAAFILRAVGLTALREAKEASAAKSAFLANMSHEIRTPLNGVLGMAQAMAAGDLPDDQRERLQIIRRSGEALLALLNDVLDLSKIEAGKVELEAGVIDFEALGRDLEASFQALCATKGVRLAVTTEASARGLWAGDPTRIRQILSNLLANAAKFTEHGQVQATIRELGGAVTITVADTGPGIPPGRLSALFDKFVQADASTTRRYGGTGLGLSICRELCTLMGGTIEVESTVGRGSVFTVRLPLARAVEAAPAAPEPPTAAFDRPLRILAAEDHQMNQAVLKAMLGQLGFEVTLVDNGRDAVAAWAREPWDVILMDVQMPDMDGPTATREIRAREREAGRAPTPIVALTANAMSHQVKEYLACGMDGFVSKPLELARLLQAIGEAIDRAPAADLAARAG